MPHRHRRYCHRQNRRCKRPLPWRRRILRRRQPLVRYQPQDRVSSRFSPSTPIQPPRLPSHRPRITTPTSTTTVTRPPRRRSKTTTLCHQTVHRIIPPPPTAAARNIRSSSTRRRSPPTAAVEAHSPFSRRRRRLFRKPVGTVSPVRTRLPSARCTVAMCAPCRRLKRARRTGAGPTGHPPTGSGRPAPAASTPNTPSQYF